MLDVEKAEQLVVCNAEPGISSSAPGAYGV